MTATGSSLPPGVIVQTLDLFFDEGSQIIGFINVSREAASGALENGHEENSYGNPYSLHQEDECAVSGSLRPKGVKDLQSILRAAKNFQLSLWTKYRG